MLPVAAHYIPFPHSTKGLVCAAFQVGGHVSMVTSHLWLSVQEHPYLMNAITIHAIAHTYCSPWVDQPLPTIQRWSTVFSL